METDSGSTSQVAQMAVVEAAHQEARAEQAEATVSAVIEQAAEAINDANQRAEAIAEAAMQTEIGRQVSALRTEFQTWSADLASLRLSLQETQAAMEVIRGQIAALATLEVSQAPASSPLIPPASGAEVITEPVTQPLAEVIPDSLNAEAASPAPVILPVRRTRLI